MVLFFIFKGMSESFTWKFPLQNNIQSQVIAHLTISTI